MLTRPIVTISKWNKRTTNTSFCRLQLDMDIMQHTNTRTLIHILFRHTHTHTHTHTHHLWSGGLKHVKRLTHLNLRSTWFGFWIGGVAYQLCNSSQQTLPLHLGNELVSIYLQCVPPPSFSLYLSSFSFLSLRPYLPLPLLLFPYLSSMATSSTVSDYHTQDRWST